MAGTSSGAGSTTATNRTMWLTVLYLVLTTYCCVVNGLHFPNAGSSAYARYPKWNACLNASISFEFRTTQSDGLLMYTDDGGTFDFIEIMQSSGRVRVTMNIVDGRDAQIQLDAGRDVSDGNWHKVELRRNRMSTTLIVDGLATSRVSFGSDFDFGRLATNNDVFFGGLPDSYNLDLHALSFPSALFQPRFQGSIRNILYRNCSCETTRAEFIEGAAMSLSPPEQCTERNPCRNGCICISTDTAPACDCSELSCFIDAHNEDIHYSLPMDLITGDTIENPSGLDAMAVGQPTLIPGVQGKAIRLHTPEQYVRVSGPSHRQECFGDLDKCPNGYTLAFWINFEHPVDGQEIFLSNGGHTDRSYGVAMIYNSGKLEFRFRRKNAEEWRVTNSDILPNRWYHLAATWSMHEGLSLYVDGVLVDTDTQPEIKGSVSTDQRKFSSFVLGRSNDDQPSSRRRMRRQAHTSVAMDEFNFWSSHKNSHQLREMGPIFRYYFPMEVLQGNSLPDATSTATIYGNPSLIKGKVGRALRLDGRMEYVDGGDVRDACLGDLQLCNYGLSIGFWINSFHVQDNMYYLDSGNSGIKVYYDQGKLIGEFQQGNRHWQTEWPDFQRNNWYFIEFSWNPTDGARMYVNLHQVAHDQTYEMQRARGGTSRFYIGRANTAMTNEKYAQAYIDEVEIQYADRARALGLGLIRRDEIDHVYVPFEEQLDNEIKHDRFRILVYNGANLVHAKVGNGVSMDGQLQYTTMGDHQNDCFGNLELCKHGLTIKMQILPQDLRDNQYFMDSGPYSLYYKNGRLYATFTSGGKTWTCSTSFFRAGNWQEVEMTWHEQRGLQMYLNGREVGRTTTPTTHEQRTIEDWRVYLGRPNKQHTDGVNGNAIIDEMELWYAHKDFIGLWPKHVKHDIIHMDRILAGNRVEHIQHEGHNVYALNNPNVVRGWVNDAIELNGINQYINGGPNCSCRGNMQRCYNGFTLRSRIKPNQLQEGMYLFSSAAYDIFYRGGKIWAVFRTPTHKWSVSSNQFSLTDWSMMEWSWHPTKGLHMFVNGNEVAVDTTSSINRAAYNYRRNFYVGRANTNMHAERYGRFTVDDVQLWEAYRETLIDNGLIDPNERRPGDVRKDIIDMDRIVGNRVAHEKHRGHNVFTYNRPTMVRGWINGAVKLDGANQYINVGANSSCGGDLENCPHGFTLRSRVRGDNLQEGQYLYSSNMYDVYYRNGKLWCEFHTPSKSWVVSYGAFNPREWNLMEFTWHPSKGLKMYMNNREVAQDRNPLNNIRGYNYNMPMYIGRANTDMALERYGQFTVDDVQLWEAWRKYLVDDGLINPETDPEAPPADIKKDIIDMDAISGNTVVHENKHRGHTVYALNRPTVVQGWIGNGIGLNGVNQYISAGANTSCNGNLATCRQGFTLRSRVRPKNLVDNMYLYSSSQYDIYYKDGKIWAEFRTPDGIWRVSSNEFKDLDWNLMEWTWHPVHGLIMYVNNREVARSTIKMPNRGIYDYNKVFYIGRANTDMNYEKYGQFVVDDVQLWESYRQFLIDEGLINPTTDPKPPVGDVRKDIIDMDRISGNRIMHTSHTGHNVFVRNQPITVRGWKGNAVRLDKRQKQFIDVGANATCQGNLEKCNNGFTLRYRIKPNSLENNQYWHSSAPYDIYYRDGKVHAVFRTPTHIWRLSTDRFNRNDWNQMDFSWHADEGLVMYVDGMEVASDRSITVNPYPYDVNQPMYIGRDNTRMIDEKYGDFAIDDVQLWEAKRQILILRRLMNVTEPRDPAAVTTPLPLPSTTTTTTTQAPENYILFDGNNWILYDMAGLPDDQKEKSDTEEFLIEFKSTQPNGLIWWAGMEDRNMHLSLKDGQLLLVADHGGGDVDRFRIATNRGRVSDGEWHTVIVKRDGRNIVVDLDGVQTDHVLTHEPSFITNGAILIGGYEDPKPITNSIARRNLDGYVKRMHVRTDNIPGSLDLFRLFDDTPRQYWVVPNGLLPENAKPKPQPVTFERRGAYLRLPTWSNAENEGTIDFKFRTTEPNGMLLFNGGPQGSPDFFSVETYDGVMHFIINTGSGVHRYPFSEKTINDGKPHHAKIERSRRQLVLHMDGQERQYNIPGPNNEALDLDSFLYVGAVDLAARLPWHLWTRQEKYFLGCLWDLEINNGRPANLVNYIREQGVSGINPGCDEKVAMCIHRPCAHGMCIDTWNGAVCNCAGTVYTGDRCELFADVVTFDGTDFLRLDINPMLRSHTDDMSIRFKTGKQNGLLFATDNRINHEYIKALIENGHGKLRTNLGGRVQVIEFGRDVADDEWHTLYIKRRADELDVWVDDGDKVSAKLPGSGWTLDIDAIHVAAMGKDDDQSGVFAGWMQNFILNKDGIFDLSQDPPPGWTKDGDPPMGPTGKPIPENAVTLTHPLDSYATLTTLDAAEDMEVSFMFKTKEEDGLLLYNGGNNNEFIAVELVGGYIHLVVNDGGTDTRIFKATSEKLNDDGWHFVKIKRVGYAFTVVVDQASASFSGRTKRQGDRLDLTGALYIGGMPRDLYNRLPFQVQSRQGFRGCLASVKIQSRLYNLLRDSVYVSSYVKENCTTTGKFCLTNPCRNRGICLDGIDTFVCDCNMTGFVGRICTDEPEGYRFGENYHPGFYVYNYDQAWSSKKDALAVGFMTWFENGTIAKIDSDRSSDYIELRMENGHVVAVYDIGGGEKKLVEDRKMFNDGNYHVAVFERSDQNATFRVDSYPVHRFNTAGTSGVKLFNEVMRVNVGGHSSYMGDPRLRAKAFNGIIAGLYFNGLRVIDSGVIHNSIHGVTDGDVRTAVHRFHLPQPRPPTALPPGQTDKPVIPKPKPPDYTPSEVPLENAGGGAVWGTGGGAGGGGAGGGGAGGGGAGGGGAGGGGAGGGGAGAGGGGAGGGETSFIVVQPGGGGAGGGGVGIGPKTAPVVSPFVAGGPAEGGRAAAMAGTFIGALLLAGSLVYALYKLKPGVVPCGGAGGGGKGGPVISSPTSRANYHLIKGGAGAAGAGAAAATQMEVANGAASMGTGTMMSSSGTQTLGHGAGGGGGYGGGYGEGYGAGGANSQTQAFAEYFSSMQQSSSAGGVGGGQGGTMMAGGGGGHGTMTRAMQTDYQSGGDQVALANNYDQQTLSQQQQQQFNTLQQESSSYSALDSYQTSSYMQNTMQQNTLHADHAGAWQMQNMALGNAQNLATLAAEEIRVDCLLMTSDGNHVVTGSIYGPPQTWDLGTGELVRIMSGEELSSTDLHLACNDTLLVGQVAEMTQVDPADASATSRVHNRKLQIWDFLTGRPLEMDKNELCTASCMMSDGERIVLGRTEKFGGGTTIVIYDLLANEPVRTLRYEAAVGFADYISYLNLSKDNRYVIAGFQNSYDGNANFIIFDLTADSYSNAVEPKLLALDACAECTAILDNHEAVTGTRNGELLIWSMRTGKPLRQLVSATGGTTMTRMGVSKSVAHAREVKAVCVSRDGKLLVSASADTTIKVWNLESERQLTTLKGHQDEVWCCTISNDNDIIVSGSRDGTLRLWRLATASPICVYNTGVDVFSARMSSNKRTIVALGDKYGARKLIMLRVVVTKTRSRAPSRATSPIHGGSRPTSPLRATSPLIR